MGKIEIVNMILSSFIAVRFFTSRTFNFKNRLSINIKMSSNLEKFSEYINGDWSNREQSMEFPALWSHIHVCYRRLPDNFIGSPSFYVESAYDYSLDKPYKTAIVALK